MNEISVNLLSVVGSTRFGIPLDQLDDEYLRLTGRHLDYLQLGYRNLESCLRDMTDVVRLSRTEDGSVTVQAAGASSTAPKCVKDIRALVTATKDKKRKKNNAVLSEIHNQSINLIGGFDNFSISVPNEYCNLQKPPVGSLCKCWGVQNGWALLSPISGRHWIRLRALDISVGPSTGFRVNYNYWRLPICENIYLPVILLRQCSSSVWKVQVPNMDAVLYIGSHDLFERPSKDYFPPRNMCLYLVKVMGIPSFVDSWNSEDLFNRNYFAIQLKNQQYAFEYSNKTGHFLNTVLLNQFAGTQPQHFWKKKGKKFITSLETDLSLCLDGLKCGFQQIMDGIRSENQIFSLIHDKWRLGKKEVFIGSQNYFSLHFKETKRCFSDMNKLNLDRYIYLTSTRTFCRVDGDKGQVRVADNCPLFGMYCINDQFPFASSQSSELRFYVAMVLNTPSLATLRKL